MIRWLRALIGRTRTVSDILSSFKHTVDELRSRADALSGFRAEFTQQAVEAEQKAAEAGREHAQALTVAEKLSELIR